jgi:hypothetical protein
MAAQTADQVADPIRIQLCSICQEDFFAPRSCGFECVNPVCNSTPEFRPQPSTADFAVEPLKSWRVQYHLNCVPRGVNAIGDLYCPTCEGLRRATLHALQEPEDHQPHTEQQQQEPPERQHPRVDDQRAVGLAAGPSDLPGPGNQDPVKALTATMQPCDLPCLLCAL